MAWGLVLKELCGLSLPVEYAEPRPVTNGSRHSHSILIHEVGGGFRALDSRAGNFAFCLPS